MQRLQLTHIHLIDIFWIVDGISIAYPVDALEVLQQLFPRHDVDGFHRIASFYLIQRFDTNPVLDSPYCLHHALGIGITIAHHL